MYALYTILIALSISAPLNTNTRWPDSLNARFVGNWPFGPSHTVVKADNYVLLGSGGGIYIVDINDPAQPVLVSDTMRTRGFVRSLRLMYLSPPAAALYVGAGKAGIEVWNVLNLPIPERYCAYNTPGYAHDYDATGTFRQDVTVVAAGDSGLRVVDLYPTPDELGFCYTPGSAQGVRYDGWYTYVADGSGGLRVINVSDPYNPFETGFYDTPGFAHAVDTYWYWPEYYAYIADGNEYIEIVDVSDPINPQHADYYYTGASCTYNVEVENSHLYISKGYDGFEAATLMPPLQYIGACNTPCYACDAAHSYLPNCALVADWYGGLRIIDVSGSFHEIGYFDVPDKAYGIYVDSSYAYIADRNGGLRILDISTPSYPRETGYCYTPGIAMNVDVSGTHAYVAAYNTGGLTVVNVATPTNPQVVGSCSTPGNAMDVHVQDTIAYIADDNGGLRIINIATSSNPYEIGFLDTPGSATGVYIMDSFVYVADGSGSGLRVIDISIPSIPQETGSCITPGDANEVYVTGSYAYVADGLTGMRVINITDPTNPYEVGYFDTPSYAYGVYVVDSFCYVADSTSLRIINTAIPTNPQEVGYYTTPDCAYDIDSKNSYIFVADGYCGLQVYQNTLIGVEEMQHKTNNHKFQLWQNPTYGDHITVQLYIDYPGNAILDIFNILGQKVKTFNLSNLTRGYDKVTISVKDLTSGVYFFQLTVENCTETKKLLLIR